MTSFEARVRGTVPIQNTTRELKVAKGDTLTVTEIDPSGWAYCKSKTGTTGWVPCSCIEPVDYKRKTSVPSRPKRHAPRPKRSAPKPVSPKGSDGKEVFPFGTKFNPNTGEKIPKFDPNTGRKNW
ncbi:hypothetical protein AAMO2058_001363300 [Amorphochlora amoebiformis]